MEENGMDYKTYRELLEKKYKATNWDSLESVKAYNEYAKRLRKMLYEEDNNNV